MTKSLKFLDVFSGIGGFRMGLERAGHECIGHIEFDKYANQSYKAIYGKKEGEYSGTDITKIADFTELKGKYDILVGGFPCQAFSIAGDRKGFQDTRGTLFFDLCRILEQTKPPLCLFENVRGLLSHNKGQTFETILKAMDDLGYDVEWEVLNSKDFVVPQNRERVFIIGHLRGERTRKVFPITSSDGENYRIQKQAVNTITTRTGEGKGSGSYVIESEQHAQGVMQVGNLIGNGVHDSNRVVDPMTKLEPVFDGISNTITTVQKDNLLLDNQQSMRIRKLTPKECWRLQGFPDWAFERAKAAGVSDSQLYKQAGNAVTVNVIEAIGRKL